MTPSNAKAPTGTAEAPIAAPASSVTALGSDELASLRDAPFAEAFSEFENLLSQGRVSFLLGAGCSHCAGLPLMDGLTEKVIKDLGEPSRSILHAVIKQFEGATRCTIEDYMSEIVDLMAIAERRYLRGISKANVIVGDAPYSSLQLATALDDIKKGIAAAIDSPACSPNVSTHRTFVRVLHNTLRGAKGSAPQLGVDYFTLNYDTLVEDALALERVPMADGFHGGATGWWNIGQYSDVRAIARVYKLHGSIDWCVCDGDVLPRRIRNGLSIPSQQNHLLIWPAATKYRETQRDPYAQLVSLMRDKLRPNENTEVALCICGYAFADEHINFEIDRALRESRERLTVIAFSGDERPTGQLERWLNDPGTAQRVRVYCRRGFFHAETAHTSPVDLPWWKFEVLTQLLAGQR